MSTKEPRGRPTAEEKAPPGHVSLREAAEQCGVSYATMYRLVAVAGTIGVSIDGQWYVTKRELGKLPTDVRAKPQDSRRAVMLRVDPARYRKWKRAAKDAGEERLSTWIGELVDARVESGSK